MGNSTSSQIAPDVLLDTNVRDDFEADVIEAEEGEDFVANIIVHNGLSEIDNDIVNELEHQS